MAEAHQAAIATLDASDEVIDLVIGADLVEHVQHGLVGATVAGAVEGGRSGSNRGVRVSVCATDRTSGRGRAVLLVVSVEDEQDVERPHDGRVGLVLVLGDLEHHRQEVVRERQVVLGEHVGHTDREAVAGSSEGRQLGDQASDLQHAVRWVFDVLRLGVEGRHRSQARDEHAHRVRIEVEAVDEAAAEVLVRVRVVGDVVDPLVVLATVGQLAVDEQVRDLEVRRLLSELLDRVPAVAQDALVALDLGDRAQAGRGRGVARVVEPQARQVVFPLGAVDTAVDDRNLERLAGAVVGDRDGIGHRKSFVGSKWSIVQ